MNFLVLAPQGPEADFSDVDYAAAFALGGANVVRLDPEVPYCQGGMRALEQQVLHMVEAHAIDVLVYALGSEFDFLPHFFPDRLASVHKVLLLGDDGQYFDVSHRYYAECFDLVLTVNPPLCDHYALFGTEAWFIPSVFSSTLFSPERPPRKEIDVSFVGAMVGKEGRDTYARALSEAGIDVRVYGAGTAAGIVSREEVIDIFRRSRINLNFTRGSLTPLDRHLSINRRVRQVKGRNAKIALCGSFILSEYAPGLEKLFDIGTEIDVFQNETDLVQKVRFYLQNAAKREAMAAKAYAHAVEMYDEAKYWPRLVAAIEARVRAQAPRPQLPLGFDAVFWSRFGGWRFKYLVIFLFTGRGVLLWRELCLLGRTRRFTPYVALWSAALGLHVASRTSRVAALVNRSARRLRRRPSFTARA
jgi:hypothetical protein